MVIGLDGDLTFPNGEVALLEEYFITIRIGDGYGLLVNGIFMETRDVETSGGHRGGVLKGDGKRVDIKDFAFSDGVFTVERRCGFSVLVDDLVVGFDVDLALVDVG